MNPVVAARRGLYISYDQERHGPIDGAVEHSARFGCVAWFANFPHNPQNWAFPTDVIIRVNGEDRYFRGILLSIIRRDDHPNYSEEGERNHRPPEWYGTY